jgi:hypothetical protein
MKIRYNGDSVPPLLSGADIAKGVLRIDDESPSRHRPGLEIIDHKRFFRKPEPQPIELTDKLVECIWKYVKLWCEEVFNGSIGGLCPVSIESEEEMHAQHAVGLFWTESCRIQISEAVLSSEPYALIVLTHEFFHYVNYCIVPREDFVNCPEILAEGFSEYCCRMFYEKAKYKIPKEMKKSWNEHYELGRQLVKHIAEDEGFGIEGFVNGFLRNIQPDTPLKFLDPLFK